MAARKHSRQRDAIKENLMHRKDHPTADMVFSDIRQEFPNISLGTVYRNLSLLSDIGEIQRLPASDGADRYDGNVVPHDHFICKCCGSVTDMAMVDAEALARSVDSRFDGLIEYCSVNFYGICGDCRHRQGS